MLITFLPDVVWGWDLVEMKDELEAIFGRRVDFLEKKSWRKAKTPTEGRQFSAHMRLSMADSRDLGYLADILDAAQGVRRIVGNKIFTNLTTTMQHR